MNWSMLRLAVHTRGDSFGNQAGEVNEYHFRQGGGRVCMKQQDWADGEGKPL